MNKTEYFETKRSFLAQKTPKICWEEGKGEKIPFAKSRGGIEVSAIFIFIHSTFLSIFFELIELEQPD